MGEGKPGVGMDLAFRRGNPLELRRSRFSSVAFFFYRASSLWLVYDMDEIMSTSVACVGWSLGSTGLKLYPGLYLLVLTSR